MDQALKQRLIGASVIIALAVIFIPMLFDIDQKQGSQTISIEIPDEPNDLVQKRIQLDNMSNNDDEEENREEVQLTTPMVSVEIPAQEEKIIEIIENPQNQSESKPDSQPSTAQQQSSANNTQSNAKPVEKEPQKDVAATQEKQKESPAAEAAQNPSQDTPQVTGEYYQIKIGSFSRKSNAEKLKGSIIQNGLEALVYYDNEKNLHTVVSNLMQDKAKANDFIAKLNQMKLKIGKPALQAMNKEEAEALALLTAKGFVVQMGSFSSKENALNFRNQLRENGFVTFVDWSSSSNGGNRYRVRVGPFIDEKDAKANQLKIKRVMNKDGLIKAHERRVVVE